MGDSSEITTASDDWKTVPGKKKKTFALEYRIRPERLRPNRLWLRMMHKSLDWGPYFTKYRSMEDRAKAMAVLNRKDTLFEYRLPEGK